ncbi:MAG: DUF5309 domain-containing protein [Muribaculaceae bacterium]|nr:DUF5309 domain-containing protein [Muribaculaceae bacterium]
MENAIISGTVTTNTVNTASPDLLLSEVERRIVKIRPMSTPIDQISRHAEARRAGSMTVDYYAVDAQPFRTELMFKVDQPAIGEDGTIGTVQLRVKDEGVFQPSDTIMIPDAKMDDGSALTAYVVKVDGHNIHVRCTSLDDNGDYFFPALPKGAEVIRMGRAAGELDVQTPQFQAIPTKKSNFCQIFKTQVEQSTLVKLSNKEAGWTLSDQEEAAIIDMRQGMERNFLFGNKLRVKLAGDDEVLVTGGIWRQAGHTFDYTAGALTNEKMIALCRMAFSGSTGSSKKLLIGGTGFIEQLHKLEAQRNISASEKKTKWGLDFTEYVSKFGTLYILSSETFDECGHADDAMVIDPEYITKYTHIPMSTEKLDLRSSGQRNSDAVVITEASCLVLRYPKAHVRVIADSSAND